MSGWNYRVVKEINFESENDDPLYGVHEVYYDEDDNPNGLTGVEVSPSGCDFIEFMESWDRYQGAFEKPILVFDHSKNKFTGEEELDNDLYNSSRRR